MNRNRGFTLVEFMIVITIVAIGVALAVPSFSDMIERKAVGGAAEAAYEQLQLARSQALKRSKPILVDFHINGTDWFVGFTDKMTGCEADKNDSSACTVDYNNDGMDAFDGYIKRIQGSNHKNITMSLGTAFADTLTGDCASAPAGTACFDYVRGLARTGAYDFASANANYKLSVEVTMLGHVNICVPTTEKTITGYRVCSG
jgi:type IV fimbrial biogenesis protein FimT